MFTKVPSVTRCCRHRLSHICPFFTFSMVINVFSGTLEIRVDIHGDAIEDREGCTVISPTILVGALKGLGLRLAGRQRPR